MAPADVDESQRAGEPAEEYVARVALDKALCVAPRFLDSAVLAADTAVVLGGKVFGKPATPQQALAMLQELAGQTHCVMTAVVILGPVPDPGAAGTYPRGNRWTRPARMLCKQWEQPLWNLS